MAPRTLLAYLSIPILFSVGVGVYAFLRKGFTSELVGISIYGGIFYAAPFALWFAVVKIGQLNNPVSHSGFIGCSISLLLIACAWFFPGDPSGLPMQWLLYWPLSLILIFIMPVSTVVWCRLSAPNKALKSDAKRRAV